MKTDKLLPSEAKQKLFSVRLPEGLTHALKIHAATTRRSVKDLVREAIIASLKAQGIKC